MKHHELLEQAHLDALGLLDEAEQKAFEAAFASAPKAVQQQVRAEQTRWATTHANFSSAVPPASLRSKVIERVMGEVHAASESRGVLATLSAPSIHDRAALVGNRVSPMWRAFALGFAAAAMVAIVGVMWVINAHRQMEDTLSNDARIAQLIGTFGSKIEQIAFDHATSRALFEQTQAATNANFSGQAALFMQKGSSEGRMIFKGLVSTATTEIRIVLLDASGEVIGDLKTITSDGARGFTDVALGGAVPGMKIAIASVGIGQPVTSANLMLVTTIVG
jgi:hypothetical protein